jgi:hypothetical protein
LSYLLPILLIGLCIYFGSRRSMVFRVRPPRAAPSIDYTFATDNDGDAGDEGNANSVIAAPPATDPIFAPRAEREDRRPVKYLLDAGDVDARGTDRVAAIHRSIAGKGLCSPRG